MIAGPPKQPRRVLVFGATGAIGRAAARALSERGNDVVCFVRSQDRPGGTRTADAWPKLLPGATIRFGDVTDLASLERDAFQGERFDAVVSCLASRTGAPKDAWAIDYQAHADILAAAKSVGTPHMVLVSAICVQKPRLAFQHAKLAFERALIESGLTYSIIRPTAFFKSLSGQLDRIKRGKPFLLFGDGALTACKPISDRDLALYLSECLDDPTRHDKILPIGGPGGAITPKQQADRLFALLNLKPRIRHVPVALLDAVVAVLATLGRVSPVLAEKAELARIGRYYATESMLVLDPAADRYDADATPSTGSETLFDFYAHLIDGTATIDRADHAVF